MVIEEKMKAIWLSSWIWNIQPIDWWCNLYPCEETVALGALEVWCHWENRTIWGNLPNRRTAKNFKDVIIIASKIQYSGIRNEANASMANHHRRSTCYFAAQLFKFPQTMHFVFLKYYNDPAKSVEFEHLTGRLWYDFNKWNGRTTYQLAIYILPSARAAS